MTCTSKNSRNRRKCVRNSCSPPLVGEAVVNSIKEIFTEAEVPSQALTKRGMAQKAKAEGNVLFP